MNEQTDTKRIETLRDFYKQQMAHYQHTQEIEWKANFGIWTLLAASIYVVTRENVRIHKGCWILLVLTAVWVIHTWWLWRVHCSEIVDKQLWSRYRAEALRLIRSNDSLQEHEAPFTRSLLREIEWLSLETMITALLCIFLYTAWP